MRVVVARAGRSCPPDPVRCEVLPATARLTHRDDFTASVRRGRRIGRKLVVMHVLLADAVAVVDPSAGPRVGFVVSKAVGCSVVRHRVARRLRHLMRGRLSRLPAGSRVVVRALPAAAAADSAALGRDLDRALQAVPAIPVPAERS